MPFELMPEPVNSRCFGAALLEPLAGGFLQPTVDRMAPRRREGEGHALAEVLLEGTDRDALRGQGLLVVPQVGDGVVL